MSGILLLCGCAAQVPEEPIVDKAETMIFLGADLRPEELLFPDYLLMEGFELDQHGRIPETTLIGADMESSLGLMQVRRLFDDLLVTQGWSIDGVEIGTHYFRILAASDVGELEIRAVQGSGPTHVFILYQSRSSPAKDQ